MPIFDTANTIILLHTEAYKNVPSKADQIDPIRELIMTCNSTLYASCNASYKVCTPPPPKKKKYIYILLLRRHPYIHTFPHAHTKVS